MTPGKISSPDIRYAPADDLFVIGPTFSGGLSMNRLNLLVLSMLLMVVTAPAHAKTTKEHPLVRPFPGSVLAENMSQYKKFNAYDFYCFNEAAKKREKKNIKGEYWRLLYEVRTPSGDRVKNISKLEFFENYRAAAAEKGGRVVIKAENKNLLITAMGKAMEKGCIGDYIRVMNISSGKEIIAMVKRTDLVEVQF